MVHQRIQRIHSRNRFFGSFDSPRSERSWINLFSKETQKPFSNSFGFKNPILDFPKETHPWDDIRRKETTQNFLDFDKTPLRVEQVFRRNSRFVSQFLSRTELCRCFKCSLVVTQKYSGNSHWNFYFFTQSFKFIPSIYHILQLT